RSAGRRASASSTGPAATGPAAGEGRRIVRNSPRKRSKKPCRRRPGGGGTRVFGADDGKWRVSAPVAQLDRVVASEAIGRGFESLQARHFLPRSEERRVGKEGRERWVEGQ